MNLEEWWTALSLELGVEDIHFNNDVIHTLLDLARDAAHEVERPAAPLTTFLVGVAVGRGSSLGVVGAQATALVMDHAESDEDDELGGNKAAESSG